MKKWINGFLLLLFMQAVYAEEVKVIKFATEATYPPFEYMHSSGKIQGFDVDVASAVCAQIQAKCTFNTQAFNSLVPSLSLGKFDAVIAAFAATPARAKQVNFTQSYYEPTGSFVADKLRHNTLASLQGKVIGVQEGSTFQNYLISQYGRKVRLRTYSSVQDAFLDLVAERVDAVLADTPIALSWLQEGNNAREFGIVEKPIVDSTYFGNGYVIAVAKRNIVLLNDLNEGLEAIKANGVYDEIVKKYFPGGGGSL